MEKVTNEGREGCQVKLLWEAKKEEMQCEGSVSGIESSLR